MPKNLPAGPYDQLPLGDGETAPFYVIPFDKKGRTTGPNTQQHLLDAVKAGGFTDLFLFSHGWNNDWKVSTERYRDFIAGFQKVRQEQGIAMPDGYKPILVGIFWPSTSLVFGKEKGPGFAVEAGDRDTEVEAGLDELAEIASQLESDEDVELLHSLAQKDGLTEAEARQLAALIAPLYADEQDPSPDGEGTMDVEALLDSWRQVEKAEKPVSSNDGFGFPSDEPDAGVSPDLAGLGFLDPRKAVRMFTVWKMKDRAGVVGGNGVAKLLRGLLDADSGCRVHLLGHSYGGKIVLSALSASPEPSRPVDSVFLLQPAVNRWCFADDVPKRGGKGAYHSAPARCRLPLFTTFSKDDSALTKFFHLSVRRGKDLGEGPELATLPAPSIYAALGGFGPDGREAETTVVELLGASDDYDFNTMKRLVAVHSDDRITGHGDISNAFTWWTLHQLVRRAAATG